MLANLMASAATFKKCTWEKLAFVILSVADLCLTLLAASLGAEELNPFMRNLIHIPSLLLTIKVFIPLFFAWLVPGKLLIPSIILLALIVGWDVRELAMLFLA